MNDIIGTFCKNKQSTAKILKIQTPEKFAEIILKFEPGGFTIK